MFKEDNERSPSIFLTDVSVNCNLLSIAFIGIFQGAKTLSKIIHLSIPFRETFLQLTDF